MKMKARRGTNGQGLVVYGGYGVLIKMCVCVSVMNGNG